MRHLSISILVLVTLSACGDSTVSPSEPEPTNDASTSEVAGDAEATSEDSDAENSSDDTSATDPTEGCESDDACSAEAPCVTSTCNLESGLCEEATSEDGAPCVSDDGEGQCLAGACVIESCGDGVCQGSEDAESCPEDCQSTTCADGELIGCDGVTCVDSASLGNGECDAALNCAAGDWDGGDCDICGNGVCGEGEDAQGCPEDCCPSGEVKDCEQVSCVSESGIGDGTCDVLLNCEAYGYDGGDCDTSAECGDGVCDASEDPNSCPLDCAANASCNIGEIVGCDGETCVDATWIGNGICNAELDCDATLFDAGDCITGLWCGNGICDPGEDAMACPSDCGGTCGDGICDPGEGGADVPSAGMACGLTCESDTECAASCMAESLGVSEPCGACFGPVVSCMYDSCLETCTNEGPASDACDACLEAEGCFTEESQTCLMTTCSPIDLGSLGGSCNQDCDATQDSCGDGVCQPDEEAQDPLELAAGCFIGCDNAPACASACLIAETGLSESCASCSINHMQCIVDNCYEACVSQNNQDQNACGACAAEAGCSNEDYALCLDGACSLEDTMALAGTCPTDCQDSACLPGQVQDCQGSCKDSAALGNGVCDEDLNCEAWGADGGDCANPTCGDQVCDPGEEASCPSDCGACDDGEISDCSGACSSATTYGDGVCDVYFNCEPLSYDGGDCESTCGDGLCATGEGPTDMGPVASNCALGCDNELGCTTTCLQGEALSEGCAGCFASSAICVAETCFNACYVDNDEEACNSCAASCYGEDFNTCLSSACANPEDSTTLNGSCPFDCGECGEGLVTDCAGECTPALWLGDGICQAELSCDALNQDMGDCVSSCGNEICDDGEGPTDVMAMVFICSMSCGPDETCLTDCLIEQTSVSFECAGCHTGFFGCMSANCVAECDGTDEAGCGACIEQAGCMEAVMACIPNGCSSASDTLILGGSCPGDCVNCAPGQTKNCMNTCSPESWLGDGSCDEPMNCAELGFDGGDCTCKEDEVTGCQGGCVKSDWIGNQYCDQNLNCEAFDYDGGDCDTCGNAWCGPNENNATCPEDCTDVLCESGKIETCDGLCVNDEAQDGLGDGTCDPSFACETWAWDGGDCCPAGEVKDCYEGCADVSWIGDGICQTNFGCVAWDFDDGDCIGCGDGECSVGEDADLCPEDCAPPSCSEGEVLGCDWACYPEGWYGDGSCDAQFQCEEAGWDGGDCCPSGFIKGCDGECGWEAYLGDGGCDAVFDCIEMEQDKGDCSECGDDFCNDYNENPTLCSDDCGSSGCGEGYLDDCFGGCTPAVYLGNASCDMAFACTAWNFDELDCCPEGQKPTCDGGCAASSVYGDGQCDAEFNCDALSFDGGDCSACGEGEITTCEGFCFPDWLLGTGDCDQELNCEALGWDGGDCLSSYCGDGTCDADETLSNCATDCDLDCGAGSIAGCFGGCVSVTLLNNGSCDDALACTYHNWDNNACGYCGDFVCDTTQENASLCPQDCGDSLCADDAVDGCEPGSCISASELGNGVCSGDLNCKAWDFEGGDCCEDPEMIKLCDGLCVHPAWKYDGSCDPGLNCEAGEWDGGDCDECGDSICGSAENSWSCPEDCTEVTCSAGQIESCDGVCVDDDGALGDGFCDGDFACAALGWDDGDCCAGDEIVGCDSSCVWEGHLGDGVCDAALDCALHTNDGGDCCGEGYIQTCDGACIEDTLLANGTCDEALNCVATDYDAGDCCPDGFLKDCSGGCTASEVYGDEICDTAFACDALEWDKGACCPAGTTANCEGGCSESSLSGDGICQDEMACETTDFDGGDCCPDNELPICNQGDDDTLYCTFSESLGDGFCDPDFNCEAYGYDAGDCVLCGNGICEPGEDQNTCMSDCGASVGQACYPDSGGVGTVDCAGECYMGMTSEACDEPFNCAEASWDWGECLGDMPKLVINEIDMKSEADEQREFIEVYNPNDEAVSLSTYAIDFYTLAGNGVNYAWINLEETFAYIQGDFVTVSELGPGETLVIAQTDVFSLIPQGAASLELPGDSESNDEGAAVLTLGGGVIDSLAWSNNEELAIHAEGSPIEVDDVLDSMSRCPDGQDTDDNAQDFSLTPPSPGTANICQ